MHIRLASVILLLLMSAAPALAQGFYYKEVRKGDTIYVFNSAANAERFDASGESGAKITKAGAGPAGETVVADSERALQLFFFKHGISEVVPEPPAPQPSAPPYRFTGLIFGDYYLFANSHLPAWEHQHGLWLRRAYFTYDHTFSPTLSTRFRLEANSNGKLAGGSLTPYVKDAYLRWSFTGRQALTLGIQPSLTFDFLESVWGLRHIEKTPLDLYRWDSSRDTGVTLSGPVNQSQTVKYALQYGNESGNNAETDKFKGYRVAARYETNPGFSVEGMFGHFQRDRDADRTTAQVFAGYRGKRGRVGAQYSFQKRRAAAGSTASDLDLNIMSAFGVFDVRPRQSSAFIRVDRYDDPCPDCAGIDYLPIDTTAPFTMTLAGIEYFLHPSVRFSPNVEWVAYGRRPAGSTASPEDDLAVRLTFYWVW
jgi:hypothetical protein